MSSGSNQIKTGENQHLSQNSIFSVHHDDPGQAAPKEEVDFAKNQMEVKRRLQQAVVYSKAALNDFFKREAYESTAEGSNPFEIAFADFLNAPSIDSIDFSEYNGHVGSRIFISVLDDFSVTSVFVKIQNSDGSIADEGYATQGLFATEWIFTAQKHNDTLCGDKITVSAFDLPGNDANLEYFL